MVKKTAKKKVAKRKVTKKVAVRGHTRNVPGRTTSTITDSKGSGTRKAKKKLIRKTGTTKAKRGGSDSGGPEVKGE